ncbi:MAG: hypothetical protein WBP93_04290 [Pyrinomonadaceae bacterium]
MMTCFLKRVLPFLLTLTFGVASGNIFRTGTPTPNNYRTVLVSTRQKHCHDRYRNYDSSREDADNTKDVLQSQVSQDNLTELPEMHVLSTNLIDENIAYQAGGKFEDVKILYPEGVLYTKASVKKYRQCVMQLSFKFDADGAISEITPLSKRVMCGDCLPVGGNVVWIDPNSPDAGKLREAAVKAVEQIKFTPFRSGGKPVPVHGFVEAVFDEELMTRLSDR